MEYNYFMTGFLRKLGAKGPKGLRTWKRRFFELHETQQRVFYYKSQIDAKYGAAGALGFIDLEGASISCKSLLLEQEENEDDRLRFSLQTPGRVYHLWAESVEDMEKWVSCLSKLLRAQELLAEERSDDSCFVLSSMRVSDVERRVKELQAAQASDNCGADEHKCEERSNGEAEEDEHRQGEDESTLGDDSAACKGTVRIHSAVETEGKMVHASDVTRSTVRVSTTVPRKAEVKRHQSLDASAVRRRGRGAVCGGKRATLGSSDTAMVKQLQGEDSPPPSSAPPSTSPPSPSSPSSPSSPPLSPTSPRLRLPPGFVSRLEEAPKPPERTATWSIVTPSSTSPPTLSTSPRSPRSPAPIIPPHLTPSPASATSTTSSASSARRQLALLRGEHCVHESAAVDLVSSHCTVPGFLFLTPFRIIFVPSTRHSMLQVREVYDRYQLSPPQEFSAFVIDPARAVPKADVVEIPLGEIDRVSKVSEEKRFASKVAAIIRRDGRKGRVLRIHTMLLQCIMISFRGDRDQMVSFFRALKNTLPRSPAASFALTYCQSFTQSLRKLSREWDALEECERIRRGSAHWRVTEMNAQYRFCRSYPTHFLVPSYMGDEGVQAMASIRGHTRVPVVTWRDECTGAVLVREMEPQRKRITSCQHSIAMLRTIGSVCDASAIAFVDTRPPGLIPDHVRLHTPEGLCGEIELEQVCVDLPSNAQVMDVWCQLESAIELRDACTSSVASNAWVGFVRQYVSAAVAVCKRLRMMEESVVLVAPYSELDGDTEDWVCIVSSLAQLLLDPFYRTLSGFQTLVEKEWLRMGFRFADRCAQFAVGASGDVDECRLVRGADACPTFVLFLDCVSQLTEQFPQSFDFTSSLLVFLADACYSSLYPTFLCNDDVERCRAGLQDLPLTVWSHVHLCAHRFHNPFYSARKRMLEPSLSTLRLVFWSDYFLRRYSAVHSSRSILEERHQLLLHEHNELRKKLRAMQAQQNM